LSCLRLRQRAQGFLEYAGFLGLPLTAEFRQGLRFAQRLAELLRRRDAQAIAQGIQHDIVDRTLPIPGQRMDALNQQSVDVLQDHVRHKLPPCSAGSWMLPSCLLGF
jgi:hypothetical protein